ncbi:MAG: arylsulfatase [Blastocatellia bacterium]|nr:arylsulfatase [Blastocatellia bacterium]
MAKLDHRWLFKPAGLVLMLALAFLLVLIFVARGVFKRDAEQPVKTTDAQPPQGVKRDAAQPAQASGKPNIIFILSDDLGYGDLGCYGQLRIKTPNLDRMASEGIRFTDFYAGSSVCAPSRCSLMTGLHQGHAFIRGNAPAVPLRPQDITVAEVLKQSGYRTAVIGKWGLGDAGTTGGPTRKGFDYSFGYLDHQHAHNHFPDFLWRNEERVSVPPGTYSHDLFTEEAISFITREQAGPFFLYLAYTLPHGPLLVPDDEPYSDEPWPEEQKNYAAMITRMDRDIGRILDLLKQLGIDDDTIVFFTSDNGPPKPELFGSTGPFSGDKGSLGEGSIRVPMIARWPGKIPAGQVSRQAGAFWDFLSTAVDIAGAGFTGETDGRSLLPVLLGGEREAAPLYWEKHIRLKRGGQLLKAVRIDMWKALRESKKQPIRLYDLETDQGEQVDLAAQHPDLVKRLKKIMKKSRRESDIWPTK